MRESTAPRKIIALTVMTASLGLFGATPACRWGNNVGTAPVTDPSGYYETAPQTLQFCASLSGASSPCVNASASDVPAFMGTIFTNPLRFVVQDEASGSAVIANFNVDQYQLPVIAFSDRSLRSLAHTGSQTLFRDPNCQTSIDVSFDGAYDRFSTMSSMILGGIRIPIWGRVSGRVGIVQVFTSSVAGACATSLQGAKACLEDPNQCQGLNSADNQNMQTQLQTLFQPYFSSGLIQLSDVPQVESLGYDISYE